MGGGSVCNALHCTAQPKEWFNSLDPRMELVVSLGPLSKFLNKLGGKTPRGGTATPGNQSWLHSESLAACTHAPYKILA